MTVTSKDIVRALEREACGTCNVGGYSFYYSAIKGFDAFAAGDADSISGLATPDDSTLVVTLNSPTGDLGYRLAMPASAPIPPLPGDPKARLGAATGHDANWGQFLVATGPYMFEGLPAAERYQGFDLAVRMVEHHVWVVGELLDRAQRLSAEQLDAPLDTTVEGIDGESLRWVLWRLVGQMEQWTQAVHDGSYDFAGLHDSPVVLRSRLTRVGAAFVEEVRAVSREGRYDETFVDTVGAEPKVLTYGGMVAHVLTFSAHHRLLAVTALAGYGIDDLGYGDPKYWIT